MRGRKNLVVGFFLMGLLLGGWCLFWSTPAQATGETCANGSPAPCVEDIQINVCKTCHSIAIPGGNRNGTDRIITASSLVNRGAAHILDPLSDRGAWLTIVNGMLGKFGLAMDPTPIAGYLNTNYCTTCTGPILGSPVQSNVTSATATVTWSTSANGWEDALTDTVLLYGTNEADVLACTTLPAGCLGVNVAFDSTPVGHHVANLTGLACGTPYYMVNQATSSLGTTRSTHSVKFRTKPAGPGCPPPPAIPSRLYLSENEPSGSPSENDRIVVIDPNPLQVDGTTPNPNYNKQIGNVTVTGKNPGDLVAHPNGSTVYVMVGANLSVIAFDPAHITSAEVASLISEGDKFNHLAVSPDGSRLYLAYFTVGTGGVFTIKIKVYDTTDPMSPALLTTITNPIFNGCNSPLGLGISPDGTKLYTACRTSSTSLPDRFYMVDTATNTPTLTDTFPRDSNITTINALAVKPGGGKVYLARTAFGSTANSMVEVFNGTTGAHLTSIVLTATDSPKAAVFSPDGSKLYVGDLGDGVHVIDTGSDTVVALMPKVTSFGFDIGIVPDGSRVYTAANTKVFVNNTATNTPITTITGDFTSVQNIAITPGHP